MLTRKIATLQEKAGELQKIEAEAQTSQAKLVQTVDCANAPQKDLTSSNQPKLKKINKIDIGTEKNCIKNRFVISSLADYWTSSKSYFECEMIADNHQYNFIARRDFLKALDFTKHTLVKLPV